MGTTFSSGEDDETDWENDDIPSLEEVIEVKSILLTLLPKELVDIIVDEAEFWLCATSEHDYGAEHPFKAAADSDSEPGVRPFDKHACCALTPEMANLIPHNFFQLRRVRFVISSHDQGWGGEPGLIGDYEGSWTWFEAKIIHPRSKTTGEEMEQVREPMIMRDLDMGTHEWTETVKNPYSRPGEGGSKDPHVVGGRGDSWTIQRNLRVNDTFQEHVVVWSIDDELDTVNENQRLNQEGIGQGAGFVPAIIGKDDRIAVMARARFPGWTNFVKSVTIQVFYSI